MDSIVRAKKYAQAIAKKKNIKLKEALELVAQENKFATWKGYKNSLDIFWYRPGFLNHWFATHKEAEECKKLTSGYLLTYKGQYFVVTEDYIRNLGIDPEADVWKVIDYDVSSSNAFEKMHTYLSKRTQET